MSALADQPTTSSAQANATRASARAPARPLSIALAGGGTGGHILPGRYLLQHARELERLERVVWFQTGRAVEERAMRGVEAMLAPATLERVALELEPAGGGAPSLPRLALRTWPEARAAMRAMRAIRADVLVGLGGFTTLPAVLAARRLNVPIVLVEINAVPGRATRWLERHAARVAHAWRATLPRAAREGARDSRHVHVGPLLAGSFRAGAPSDAESASARAELGFDPRAPLLVVLGGSQGALGLNRFVVAHARRWLDAGVQVLHQVGPARANEAAPIDGPGYRAVEFVDDVARALRASTYVLCRGGASTLAEVAALARPVCVVPYPHHPDRHQEINARELGRGARICAENALDARVADEIARLLSPAGAAERDAQQRALIGALPLDGVARLWTAIEELASPRSSRAPSLGTR